MTVHFSAKQKCEVVIVNFGISMAQCYMAQDRMWSKICVFMSPDYYGYYFFDVRFLHVLVST